MKHLKKYETIVYSDDVKYEQIWKKNHLNTTQLMALNKTNFKLDDYVRVIVNDQYYVNSNGINKNIKNNIFQIKAIDLNNRYYHLTNPEYSFYERYDKKIIMDENQLEKVTDKEGKL